LVGAGLGAAYRVEDRDAVRTWAIRHYETATPGYESITDAAVQDTAVRRVMFERMRANIRLLLSDSLAGSSLIRPRANDSLYRTGLAMWQLGRLSAALMGFQGQYAAARDTLNIAIALIPNACNAGYLHALRALAEHKLGDTAAAHRDALAWKGQGLSVLGTIGDSITRVIAPRYLPDVSLDSAGDGTPDRHCFNWAARPR
jgi:hypothetical protein